MNKIISMLLMGGLLLTAQPAAALKRSEVIAWTEALSGVSAVIAYVLACPGSLCGKKWSEEEERLINDPKRIEWPFNTPCGFTDRIQVKNGFGKPLGVSAATFAFANVLFGYILSKYTPNARYEWAQKILADFERKYLFNQIITQDNISQVLQDSGCETQGLALVTAFLELQYFDNQLGYMTDQLNRGINDEGYSRLGKKMEEIKGKISSHLVRIRANEATVKSQPQWMEQWKIHEQRVLAREKMAHNAMHAHTHVVWHI